MNLFKKHKKFEEQLSEQIGDMEVKPSTSLWDRIDSNLSNDSFEAGMQNSLENFEQMPHPETWDKIAAELPETKVKNGLVKYYAVAAFAVLFASGMYIGNRMGTLEEITGTSQRVEDPNRELGESVIVPADKEEIKTQNKSKGLSDQSQPVSGSKGLQTPAKTSSNLVAQNEIVKQLPSSKTNTQSEQKKVISSTEGPSKVLTGNSQIITPIRAVTPALLSQAKAESEVTQNNNPLSQPIQNEASLAHTNEAQAINSNPPAPNNGNDNPAVPANEQQRANVNQQTANSEAREVVATEPDSNLLAQKIAAINQLSAPDELTKFSLSVYAGAFMCYTAYAIPSGATLPFDDNVKLRKQLERPAMDWSGGVTIDYRLNQKWMISTGLMMVNFNQEFNYDISTAAQPANPNEIGAPVSNPSDSFIVGNKYSNRIKYSWTEIPVLVNYTIRKGKRVDIDLQVGASYAFINTIDGGMVSYDSKGVLILTSKESFPYIQNTVFASVMPQVSYKFGQAVSVGLAPTVKYSITSIIGNENWIQQHPYFIGMNICLRKRF